MLDLALAVAKKDLKLTFRSAGLVQALLLGLLLIFMFSLSQKTGDLCPAQTAATIFWLSSAFCQVLVFNTLFSFEEADGARTGLLLTGASVTGVFLGKAIAGFILILISQICFLPASIVFLGQSLENGQLFCLFSLPLVDLGLATLGALLGALAQGQSGRESLLSLLVFPLLIPVLLAGITLIAAVFGDVSADGPGQWLGFAGAFDAIFLGAGLLLFRFIYTGED